MAVDIERITAQVDREIAERVHECPECGAGIGLLDSASCSECGHIPERCRA